MNELEEKQELTLPKQKKKFRLGKKGRVAVVLLALVVLAAAVLPRLGGGGGGGLYRGAGGPPGPVSVGVRLRHPGTRRLLPGEYPHFRHHSQRSF